MILELGYKCLQIGQYIHSGNHSAKGLGSLLRRDLHGFRERILAEIQGHYGTGSLSGEALQA